LHNAAFVFPYRHGFGTLRLCASLQEHEADFAIPCFGTKAFPGMFSVTRFQIMVQLLTTADERAHLLTNGAARASGQGIDPLPVVRLFTPDAHATWLLAALDPADGDTAWGLIDLGLGMPVLGTVRLSDLVGIVGPRQQPVMRDRYFRPTRTLSEYTRLAERDGAIPD
jgi:hypothetical protein